ncbi:MAG TPA: winged helix-turn-helix domain-containing protein [Vicinamibacterales bacterium]|nr:winged helix-turn-helix domain-containing protein [Vicinamibacterales bacterium]
MSSDLSTDLTFGPFTLDAGAGRLVRDGKEVKLRPRAFHVLRVLLTHSGRPLGYEQLMKEAWEGTFVSRHTVDVTVREVKKTLEQYGEWITHRPKVGYCFEIPSSEEHIRRGWHFWSRRTREGFEHAIESFEQAKRECSADFRAFEGVSVSYLALATFGMRPPREMYTGFLEAHERAVALGGLSPEMRCNRAHGLHLFERRLDDAEAEFRRTLTEKPSLATTYVRFAMLCTTRKRYDEALETITRGYRADPLLPMLPVMESDVYFFRREYERAIQVGAKLVELHPYLQVGRAIYARALEYCGRPAEALEQYQLGSMMSPDLPWLRALEGACLANMGRTAEALAIVDALERLRCTEYVDAFFMAVLRIALDQREQAFAELERACEENSARLYSLGNDPKMDYFAGDPRFVSLREKAGVP